jgi:hypothetical protein
VRVDAIRAIAVSVPFPRIRLVEARRGKNCGFSRVAGVDRFALQPLDNGQESVYIVVTFVENENSPFSLTCTVHFQFTNKSPKEGL